MTFFRWTAQLMLLVYAGLVLWLGWDIWLMTPHPAHLFKKLMEGGVVLLLLPPLWSWLTWRRGAIAAANVCAGSVVWFLAAILGGLWYTHLNAIAVCHAWHAGQTTMLPKIGMWIHEALSH
jgi:hypothetical protein